MNCYRRNWLTQKNILLSKTILNYTLLGWFSSLLVIFEFCIGIYLLLTIMNDDKKLNIFLIE